MPKVEYQFELYFGDQLYTLIVVSRKFLIIGLIVILVPLQVFSFSLSKPRVFYDKGNEVILVMVFLEDVPDPSITNVIKRQFDVTLVVETKLMRKDFGVLNIQTEITNIVHVYKLSYDFLTENYMIYNNFYFRAHRDFFTVFENLFPIIVKINLKSLKGNPDFEEVYPNTEFFVSVKSKIVYMNLRPPLSIITSLLGISNYETRSVVSDTFVLTR